MDGVLEVILGFVPYGIVAMTNRATCHAWKKVARSRLMETCDRTGLDLESVHRSFGQNDVSVEAIFRAMRGIQGPPDDRNSFEGLVFVLALVLAPVDDDGIDDDDEILLRILEAPDVTFDGDRELELVFATKISTKREFLPDPDDDIGGVPEIFVDDDSIDKTIIMKVTAYDRKTKKVAEVYRGQLQYRIIPHYYDELDTSFGFSFQAEKIDAPSTHILKDTVEDCGCCVAINYAHGEIYVDAEPFRRDVVPETDLDHHDRVTDHFQRWQVPAGTTFTTVKLAFQNIDDIAHLKAILPWTTPPV